MVKALVLGTAGLQINIPIDLFPLDYQPIIFMDDKVSMDIAGVGYSHCLVLGGMGDEVDFLTGIGNDRFAPVIEQAIGDTGAKCIIDRKEKESLVSVVLYDNDGRRTILREGRKDYMYVMNEGTYEGMECDYDVALFSMAGFSKHLLPVIRGKGIPIACDMQDISNLSNEYGHDFMTHSDIIFFSNDNFDGNLEEFVYNLYEQYGFKIIGVGMGSEGCLLCAKGKVQYYPSIADKVVNTVGAGDALFACFIHCYLSGDTPEVSIQKAQIFTAEKIRYATSSQGFMNKEELEAKYSIFY
jgi:ribokinase